MATIAELFRKAVLIHAEKEKQKNLVKPDIIKSVCPVCDGKGWYFVNEWMGSLQGRKDCKCKGQTVL